MGHTHKLVGRKRIELLARRLHADIEFPRDFSALEEFYSFLREPVAVVVVMMLLLHETKRAQESQIYLQFLRIRAVKIRNESVRDLDILLFLEKESEFLKPLPALNLATEIQNSQENVWT
jgi:hypothetical protein